MALVSDSNYWHNIWQKFREGDKEAFAIFYNRHIDRVYSYGLKLCNDENLVKDAIQEVFLDLYLKRETNKTNPENLRYYLFLAVKRALIKHMKSGRLFDRNEISDGKVPEFEFGAEYELIEEEKTTERRKLVTKAIDQLPSKQKEAVYLRFNEGMEYKQIANILNINIESVRKQIYRALKTIKNRIDNHSFIILIYFIQKKLKKSVHI